MEVLRRRRDLSSHIHVNNIKSLSLIEKRYRRSSVIHGDFFPTFPVARTSNAPKADEISKMDASNTHYTYVYREVNASVFTLKLDHFKDHSYYVITVKACREGEGATCGMSSAFQILSHCLILTIFIL